ncbi:purine/pyrimidine permease [Neiella marina]|uniref:Purine/pyrimidine permease n=1 Tax=Neiella holothuriorum TaxID=2870530 RepID=A0ABS7EBR8_9GAMM|nr:solute carrier family 23 protein [Neiella holothuriorum]MBW8189769.1 purine/pyrimidine permease [Neiella holothuriorum]
MFRNLMQSLGGDAKHTTGSRIIYGLDDNPPWSRKSLAAVQHLLAIFVSIITAPLIIANGMGLSAAETSYMISCSLVVSGLATLIQVRPIGPIGSGLLAIQGTSFSFIGPLIFASSELRGTVSNEELLGIIFGSAGAGAIVVMILSQFLQSLQRVITSTVAGTAVILLGITLVMKTGQNLERAYQQSIANGEAGYLVIGLAVAVVGLICWFATRKSAWLRLSSISIGLGICYLAALLLGQVNFSIFNELPSYFYPQPLQYPIGFDWAIFFTLLPIYLVTATESVGDLTATSSLSSQPIRGPKYWRRIKNGVLGDGFNSLLASVFNTFPNTTFSQNNGVIQLTGVASRHIGKVIAALLIVMGCFPVFGGIFQTMPAGLLFGATGLMFALVGLSGIRIIRGSPFPTRSWQIVALATLCGFALTLVPAWLPELPQTLIMLLGFPVAGGTLVAAVLELVIPIDESKRIQPAAAN